MEKSSESLILKSFESNTLVSDEVKKQMKPELDNLLHQGLGNIPAKKVFVDLVPSLNLIEVNMNIGNKTLLNIRKVLGKKSDDLVYYSICSEGSIYKFGQTELRNLVERIQKKLN